MVANLQIVDFFSCYGKLLKSTQLSDEEHGARHELICYMQTKLDDYQWATVKAFHDQVRVFVATQFVNRLPQVTKSWERGLISLDDTLEKFKLWFNINSIQHTSLVELSY